jgi:hypothetical protein
LTGTKGSHPSNLCVTPRPVFWYGNCVGGGGPMWPCRRCDGNGDHCRRHRHFWNCEQHGPHRLRGHLQLCAVSGVLGIVPPGCQGHHCWTASEFVVGVWGRRAPTLLPKSFPPMLRPDYFSFSEIVSATLMHAPWPSAALCRSVLRTLCGRYLLYPAWMQ